jgi:CubicO group peptidase (beta-lactamase class C family)
MPEVTTYPNPDLTVPDGHMVQWNRAENRRWSFHNLHRIARYSCCIRSASVMRLSKRMNLKIAELECVQRITSLPWFSGMVVIRDQDILFERYAADFGSDFPHSMQSVTKTMMNLVIGQLVEDDVLELSRAVSNYIPEIGSGYAEATLQQVLNMDVVNDYTEDFTDFGCRYYEHEEAMGWRLPAPGRAEQTECSFLTRIQSNDIRNRSGYVHYKDANTALLGWIAERASGRPLREFLSDIVNAAGLEHVFYITTDRAGFPTVEGGACMSARDLARYFALFARGGRGIRGESVGSASFIKRSLEGGVPMTAPYEGVRYSNHLMLKNSFLGHGGWGGQYALVNTDNGTSAVFFSVLENEHATNGTYLVPVIDMLEQATLV